MVRSGSPGKVIVGETSAVRWFRFRNLQYILFPGAAYSDSDDRMDEQSGLLVAKIDLMLIFIPSLS